VATAAQLRGSGVSVRQLEPEDLPGAATLAGAAFGKDLSRPADRARWLERVAHAIDTDPHGCFVAEDESGLIGAAEVIVRDGMWILSLLTVDPQAQSVGAGRLLMQRALRIGDPAAPGLIVSSNDSRALRLYAMSGFTLLPTLQADGSVRRDVLPAAAARVRDDLDPDFEALAALSRAVRGAEHTPELRYALRRGGRLLTVPDRGFAIANPGQGVWILVALDEETARDLLWRGLEVAGDAEGQLVRWMLGRQAWAVDVACRAGLRVSAYGAIAVRGKVGPLQAFLPSAPFG
jgi:ribosomal protein S18 acetylase RimI-like enzyme